MHSRVNDILLCVRRMKQSNNEEKYIHFLCWYFYSFAVEMESQVELIVLWSSFVYSGCIMHILANIVCHPGAPYVPKVCDFVPHAFWIL